jgi:hypothetical protein
MMSYLMAWHVFVEATRSNLDTPPSELIDADPQFAEAWSKVLEGHEATLDMSSRLLRGGTVLLGPDQRERCEQVVKRWVDER